jgi:hypothetical protein
MTSRTYIYAFGLLAAIAIAVSGCGSDSKPVASPSPAVPPPAKPATVPQAPSTAAPKNAFIVFDRAGQFCVAPPEPGFEWKKLQDIASGDQRGSVHVCTRLGGPRVAILVVIDLEAKADADRRNFIAGQYDGFRKSLEQSNGKILEGERPALESNIPARVSYAVKAQTPDGTVSCCHATIMFEGNTVNVTARASDAIEARELCERVVASLKKSDH